jgi:hypothetical protein
MAVVHGRSLRGEIVAERTALYRDDYRRISSLEEIYAPRFGR